MGGKKQTLTTGREHVEKMVAKTSELDRIRKIDFNKEIEAKEKALLEKYLAQVVAGLKQENEKLNIDGIKAKDMEGLFAKSSVEWNAEEKAAMAKLSQGLSKLPSYVPGVFLDKYWLPVLAKAKKLSKPKISPTASLRHEVDRKKLQTAIERQRQFQAYNQQLYLSTTAGLSSGAIKLSQVQASPKKEIRDAVAQYKLNKKLEKPKGKEKWYQNLPAKTKAWYEKQTTFTKAVLIGGGALLTTVVAIKLAKYFWKKITASEKQKSEAGFSTLGMAAGAGVLSLLGLGIYNREKIGTWFKDLFGEVREGVEGIKEQANTFRKMQESVKLAASGDIIGAFNKWFETPDPEEELHKKAEKKFKEWNLPVSQRSFRLVSTMGYSAFMEEESSWMSFASGKLNRLQAAVQGDELLPIIMKEFPDVSSGNENLYKIFSSLEETKGTDGKPIIDRTQMKSMTVDEVLEKVLAKDLSKVNEEMKEKANEEEEMGILYGTLEYNRKLFAAASKDMLNDFKWLNEKMGGGSVYDVIERFEKKWNDPNIGFEWGDWVEFPMELFKQCKQQGIPIAVSAGAVLIYDGVKWVTLSLAAPIGASFYEYVHSGDIGNALAVYGITTSPFIIAGVTKGLWQGEGMTNKLKRATLGGAKGFAAPIKLVEVAYDAQYYGLRTREYLRSKARLAKTGIKSALAPLRPTAKWRNLARQHAAADRILALEEKKHLINQKIDGKLSLGKKLGAKGVWEAELAKVNKEILKLKERLGSLGRTEVATLKMFKQRAALQLEGLYGKKIPESAIKKIAEKIAHEQLTGGPIKFLSKSFLFERYSSKFVRHLSSCGFNEVLMSELMVNEALMERLAHPRILRNQHFLKGMQLGIENGYLVEGGKLRTDLIVALADQSIAEPNFAGRWLNALKEKMGDKFNKVKSRAAQTRIYQSVAEKYQVIAERGAKLRQIPDRLASRMALKISATDARAKLDKLKKIAEPGPKTQKEIQKLTQFLEKNSVALVEIQNNPKLLKTWEKYQNLMKKAGGEAAGETISATRFLRYRSVLLNAARFGGVAFVVMMVHGMENADNKADFIGKTGAGLVGFGLVAKAGFAGGARLAQLGIKAPGPLVVKALGGALGLVGGFVGAHVLESVYNYGARTVGDRFFVNRGQSRGWETAASSAEVLGGAGINNFAELFDSWDIWNNIDMDEVIGEHNEVNHFAYQEYLQASSVDLLAWERRLYRGSGSWDREMNQLIAKAEEEIIQLEEKQQKFREDSKEWGDIQNKIDSLTKKASYITDNLLIRVDGKINEQWKHNQEKILDKEKEYLANQQKQFVAKLPSHMQEEAKTLISKMQDRISRNAGYIIDPESDQEEKLWLRLRDVAPITLTKRDDENNLEKIEYSFPEWFLNFKAYAKRRYIYETIRDKGKLPNVPLSGKSEKKEKPKKPEEPSKEGGIEHAPGTV